MTRQSVLSAGMCVVTLACLWPAAALGQCEYDWLPGEGAPGADSPPGAHTIWDPDGPGPEPEVLVVGGSFTVINDIEARGIAVWDGMSWSPLQGETMGGSFTAVSCLAVYDGDLIAGGTFTDSGGVSGKHVARWDGQQWQPLGSGFAGDSAPGVSSLAVYGGDLFAAGRFSAAGGVPCSNIARWDGQQWQPLGTGTNNAVEALTTYGGDLIVGGWFTIAGDVSCPALARWDGQQWQLVWPWTTWAPVYALTVYDGKLAVAGSFSNVYLWDGQERVALGGGMASWDYGPWVNALAVFNGELVAGGAFTDAGGRYCGNIAAWNGQEWHPFGGGTSTDVFCLMAYGDALVVTGAFHGVHSFNHAGWLACKFMACWDAQDWSPIGTGMNDAVQALAVYNGELIAGGRFFVVGDGTCRHIARRGATQWQPMGEGRVDGVNTLTTYDGRIVAGGDWVWGVADWDGQDWRSLGTELIRVRCLAVYHGQLIAGGDFSGGGGPCRYIARWDGQQWQGLGTGMNGRVNALAVYDGELVAGGGFSTAGDVPCNRIARWDGQQWQPMGDGMNEGVNALAVYDGQVVAAGSFTTADGVACNYIARWDGQAWQPMGDGMNDRVRALAVYNAQLIAGGDFTSAGGVGCSRIARWHGQQWQPMGEGMGGSGYAGTIAVYALTVHEGQLIVGGSFTRAGGNVSAYWARWGPIAPTAAIGQWRSVAQHGALGELPIVLDPVVTTGQSITSDPRRYQSGDVQKIEVDITGPADGSLVLANGVEAAEAGGLGYTRPADQQQLVWNGGDSYTLTAAWTGGLPDGRCYRIDLGGCVGCLGGDSDCLIRMLCGDTNNDGRTNLADMAMVKLNNGEPVIPDNINLDVNLDGMINLADMAAVKLLNNNTATCP